MLRSGETAFTYERSVQPLPMLGPWASDPNTLLETNNDRARRERLTMVRLFEELSWLGNRGGYDAVRRYAAN
ncbi:IstB-like ATP-binding protein [Novosphingobium sp. Rr 2-17]|nr:IstB-like ATP-binding protein [Novosphingobium sp. Rr 2-17]